MAVLYPTVAAVADDVVVPQGGPMTTPASCSSACTTPAARRWPPAGCATSPATRVEVRSAGSIPGDQVNPAAVEAMAEVGIDISDQRPKVLTTDAVEASDVVITMGCGDACPVFPGKRYVDWELDDPAGKGVEAVRPIRDEIERRVRALLSELGRAGSTRPVTSPKPIRPPPAPGAVAVIVTTSPSSRNVRVEPSASVSGSAPFQVSSSSEPRWSRSGPLTVPEANRSPVRSEAPLTVRCASCWAARPVHVARTAAG